MNAEQIIEMIESQNPPMIGTSSELFDEIKKIKELEEILVTEVATDDTKIQFREIIVNSTKVRTIVEE